MTQASASSRVVETRLVRRVRLLGQSLWVLVALIETLLLARIVVMAITGVTGSMTGTSTAATVLFAITGFVNLFNAGVGFIVPLGGFSHAFDIAAVLVMNSLFFVTLAATKLAIWYARVLTTAGEPVTAGVRRGLRWIGSLPRQLRAEMPRRRARRNRHPD
jgi:hypothetical protein